MKKFIGICQAKRRLPALLERVSKGNSFTITKYGHPVAVLCPVSKDNLETLGDAIEAIKSLRKKYTDR